MAAGAIPSAERVTIGAVVAAILLPPLGIFIARGIGPSFWIGAVLTLFGWLPGIAFALVAILRPDLLGRYA